MTTLNQKRVIPHTRYISLRWLPIAAAVLALVVAVQWLPQTLRLPVQPDNGISSGGAAISTSASTSASPTEEVAPTVTEGTQPITDASGTTAGGRPGNIHIYRPNQSDATGGQSTSDQSVLSPHNTGTTSRTTQKFTTTTTKSTTSTTTTTTTTATTTTTRPYWRDVTPASVTEDDLPIEELEWTYKPITSTQWTFPQYMYKYKDFYYGSTTRNKTASGVPLNQCIKVTGFKSPASNGIYRVPAMIDGKVVAAVDFSNSFTDKAMALTVKRIYFPPDMLDFEGGTENCFNLERLYFTSPEAYFPYTCIPDQPTRQWGGVTYYFLTIYQPATGFYPLYAGDLYSRVFLYACKGNIYDAEVDILGKDACEKLYGGGGV